MAKEIMDLTGLVVGPLKIVQATDQRDSSKRVVWQAECTCGEMVFAAKPDLERYAGYDCCPGHPPKGQPARIVEDFKLHPDMKGTDEQLNAVRDWELKRHPASAPEQQPEQEPDMAPSLESETASCPEAGMESTQEAASGESEETGDSSPITKASNVLEKRLGLTGYKTEAVTLTAPVIVLGCTAEKVVFARQIGGEDRVLLHLQLVDGGGKRSIVSSRKKVPEAEWATLTETLTGMQLTWRDREPRRKAKAA